MADGARIVVRRHGNPDARVRVFASDGNGFAIDGYLPFWQFLCPRYDVVVFDMRNHGRNPTSEPLNHDDDHMARDMAEIHTEISGRLGAGPELERRSPTAATNKAMADEGGFDYVAIPGTGHMLQLEEPEACVEAMEKFLARHGLAA